ncbi:hypothetical protein MO973_06745 [Paenibacillus sp. TRM 82003]|nr:hypothetical protein [Paenibacillus sp. TRM 82003]
MDSDFIIQLYHVHKSVRKICQLVPLTRNQVARILAEAGITLPNRKRNLTAQQEAAICEGYLAGRNMSELAYEFGVDSRTIRNRLQKHGVPIASPIPGQYEEVYNEWRELYESGLTFDAIAVLFGANKETVRERLRLMGVKSRRSAKIFSSEIYDAWGELYLHGATLEEIGSLYGVSATTVSKHLEKLGIKRRNGYAFPFEVYASWADLYLAGHSTREIAFMHGITKFPVTFHLRRLGVNLRQDGVWNLAKPHLLETEPSDEIKALIIGSALGDGTLCNQANGAYLRMKHKVGQRDYLNYKVEILGDYVSKVGIVDAVTYIEDKPYRQAYASSVPNMYIKDIFMLTYTTDGRFILPLLPMLCPLSLAITWCDDGYYTKERAGILNSCGFSWEDNEALAQHLHSCFGVHCHVNSRYDKKYNSTYPTIYITVEGMKQFVELIAPYVPTSMKYKIGRAPN